MATAREWAEGYLSQARADLRGAELIQGSEPSVVAMLVQMALEKASKAALLRAGATSAADASRSHAAATRMVQHLARSRRACRHLGWTSDVLRAHVSPIVSDLERAHPQLAAGGACLEYPWEDAAGVVRWPARDLAVARKFAAATTSGQLVFRFARDLCARFDAVFP